MCGPRVLRSLPRSPSRAGSWSPSIGHGLRTASRSSASEIFSLCSIRRMQTSRSSRGSGTWGSCTIGVMSSRTRTSLLVSWKACSSSLRPSAAATSSRRGSFSGCSACSPTCVSIKR
eukprot:Amastigsp_a342658_19.p5 type:complete len:117 gc:universal Amastigsp_a342658_19:286-636(+)